MKKIIGIAILTLLLSGTVAATSINGDYNGNPIVNITSNGVSIPSLDVPAVIYQGRTMVPISMLKQLGVGISWDPQQYWLKFQYHNTI